MRCNRCSGKVRRRRDGWRRCRCGFTELATVEMLIAAQPEIPEGNNPVITGFKPAPSTYKPRPKAVWRAEST